VLTLDAGSNKLAFDKNAVVSFNGGLHFHLYTNAQTGILTSLTELSSSSLITISIPTYTITENLPQNSTISSLSLTG